MAVEGLARPLTLYSRSGCHLCVDLLADLEAVLNVPPHEVTVVDVDDSQALQQAYGARVPVLVGESGELCSFCLDPAAVRAYLAEIR